MYYDCGRRLYLLNVGGLRRSLVYSFRVVIDNNWNNSKGLKSIFKIKLKLNINLTIKGCGISDCIFQSNSDGKIRFTFSPLYHLSSIGTEKNVDDTNITMPYICPNNFESKNVS